MTMLSILQLLPRLANGIHRPLPTKSLQPSPRWLEKLYVHRHVDLEDEEATDSSSESHDCWEQGTPIGNPPNVANVRSRGKVRSSPTQSIGSVDPEDRFSLLRQDFIQSEDSSLDASTNGRGGMAGYIKWLKLFGLAAILTNLFYYSAAMFLETAYFPAHGRMLPGGLKDLVYTPMDGYNVNPRGIIHIPRIVHVTYKSKEQLPLEWQQSMEIWEKMHPDWEVRFWSDKDIEDFVRKEFPHYQELHESYEYVIQRVDSVRYMILHRIGGVYSDMDIYPARALDELLEQWENAGKTVLLAESFNLGVTNAFMASAPESTFMGCVVENLPYYQHQWHHLIHWAHWEVLSSAGSTYLWGMVGRCANDEVEILDARSFRGCSVCDAWETGQPVKTCDTKWFHHSSTNSSWHQHGSWFHSLCFFVSYCFMCNPFRTCFLVSIILLALVCFRAKRQTVITNEKQQSYGISLAAGFVSM